MNGFAGQTVLITGAASGIGRATAIAFAQAGAGTILADISDLSAVMAEVVACGERTQAFRCDVADPDSVAHLFSRIEHIDCLVNAAGILVTAPIDEMASDAFDRQISVNLRGSFLMAQGAVRLMQPVGGRIVLIASELAHQGRAGASAYCASKAGVIGLTRALARECAPQILVNAVAPGPVDTPMLAMDDMSPAELAAETANPLGRVGRVEEIAATILYLAGPGGSFMTGQTICPSGGAVML